MAGDRYSTLQLFLLAILFVANYFLLRSGPTEIGEAPQEENPLASGSESAEDVSVWSRIRGLLSDPAFVTVCVLSVGFTLLRETFNTWTPTYFVEMLQMTESSAATQSAYFPLLGAVSVVLAGFLGDRLGLLGRARMVVLGSIGTTIALVALAQLGATLSASQNVALVALIGFLLIGPYSYLGGAIAMDFGGKKASGTACGIIDGVGYLAGVLAGDSFARLVGAGGWQNAFMALSVTSVGTVIAALMFLRLQARQQARSSS